MSAIIPTHLNINLESAKAIDLAPVGKILNGLAEILFGFIGHACKQVVYLFFQSIRFLWCSECLLKQTLLTGEKDSIVGEEEPAPEKNDFCGSPQVQVAISPPLAFTPEKPTVQLHLRKK